MKAPKAFRRDKKREIISNHPTDNNINTTQSDGNKTIHESDSVKSYDSNTEYKRDFVFAKCYVDIEKLTTNKTSFSQVPLKTSINRVDNGSSIISELCKIFQGRVDMEDREIGYSIKVSRPNLYENEIRLSTSERALGYFKNYYLYLSREQASFRRLMDENVVFELDNYKATRLREVTKHKEECERVSREIQALQESLAKTKKSLLKTMDDVEAARDKLQILNRAVEEAAKMSEEKKREKEKESKQIMGRILSAFETTPEQDRDKQLRRLNRLEAEMVARSDEIATKKKALLDLYAERDVVFAEASKAFELAEKGRLQHTEKVLRTFCKMEREALESRLRLLKSLEEGALSTLDAQADAELFSSRERDPERTHRCSNAMQVMDWDYQRRCGSKIEDGRSGLDQEVAESSVWSDVEGEDPDTKDPDTKDADSVTESTPPDVQEKSDGASENEKGEREFGQEEDKPADGSVSGDCGATENDNVTCGLVEELTEKYIFDEAGADRSESNEAIADLCERAFADEAGMDMFLQVLDDKRGRSAVLGENAFKNMTTAMKCFLDKCLDLWDVKAALRIANMSITFHMRIYPPATMETGEEGDQDQPVETKHYVQREQEIREHKLWHLKGFWEDALMHGVKAQLNMMEPVLWDELEPDMLREKVIAIHNIVFGQLGTMAFTMHEMGLLQEEVERLIMSMSAGAQLGEDQQLELLSSISLSYKNTVYPERSRSSSTLDSTGAVDGTDLGHKDVGSDEVPKCENADSFVVNFTERRVESSQGNDNNEDIGRISASSRQIYSDSDVRDLL